MFIYAAALAVMFICQNGLTGVIQVLPARLKTSLSIAIRLLWVPPH